VSSKPRPIDRAKVKTFPARSRRSKLKVGDEAVPHQAGASLQQFLDGLPDVLGAKDFRAVVSAWQSAWSGGRTVLWGFGAHLIKVGLSPVVVDLMERGAISAVFMNGAGCVHDLELAMMGRTSEDVGEGLDDGSFGMARETGERLNHAINRGAADGLGMGESVGREILEGKYRHKDRSLLASAARLGIPATVHVAIGSDIHHMHPSADGAALGETSFRDFEKLASVVAGLERGVVFNVGSAVILPEVFLKALSLARNLGNPVRRLTAVDLLKALSLARNLGNPVRRLTAVDLDFIRSYRPRVNIVDRPTRLGGKGYALVGQHEILVPLLSAGVIEAHAKQPTRGSKKNSRSSNRSKSRPKVG